MDLAALLGWSVGEVLDRLSSAEVTEWFAYLALLDRERQDREKRSKSRH